MNTIISPNLNWLKADFQQMPKIKRRTIKIGYYFIKYVYLKLINI